MRRIVSIWLPRWPVDRRRLKARRARSSPCAAPPDHAPFAFTEASGNAVRLSAVNEAAAAHGLYPEMMLTDARSMVPELATAPAEPQADAHALARLARWLTRYSPWTNVDGTCGVLLDITGCAGLFGGEAKLLADMERRLTDFGLGHRLGLADTPGAAHVLARYGSAPAAPPGGTAEALAALPVEGLRLDLETVTLLKRLGLKRIGQLYDLPRAALARRFRSAEQRAAVLTRLDQALGRIEEPLSPLMPVPDYRAGLSLAEPVQEVAAVTRILEHLTADLCRSLKERGLGAQRLTLDAWRVDGTVARLTVGASRPTQDPRHMERLFAEHLEGMDAGFGIDRAVLGADRVAPLTARQSALDAGEAGGESLDEEALARLIDRLAARFGEAAVTRLAPADSHLPERAERAVPAMGELSSRFDAPHPPTPPARRGPLPLPGGEGKSCPPDRPSSLSPAEEERCRTRITSSPSGEEGARGGASTRGKVRGVMQNRTTTALALLPPRPLLLFERPEPVAVMAQIPDGPPLRFRWRRVVREVARAEGPERIAPEWWLDPQGGGDTRDYYRVEDRAGRRYWLYREGLYGEDRREPPRWYVHGVFG